MLGSETSPYDDSIGKWVSRGHAVMEAGLAVVGICKLEMRFRVWSRDLALKVVFSSTAASFRSRVQASVPTVIPASQFKS